MSEMVCKDVGNYIGEFLESNRNTFVGVWRDYLRIRAIIQVDKSLKRSQKIKKLSLRLFLSLLRDDWFWVNFKYEHVPTFYFICGLLGHAEKFCSRIFAMPLNEIVKSYGPCMKVVPRRQPVI